MCGKTAVIATTALTLLLGCHPSPPSSSKYNADRVDRTPVDGGTFIEASIGDPTFLNPILATDSASGDINGQIYNGLVKYDKNIVLIGDLAERWDVTNEGKTITFRLRKGVRWHDGTPFTSADVLFTYQNLIDPHTRTPYSTDFQMIKTAEALDPTTFRVTYKQPFAPALESWGMGIIPKHIYEKGDINEHPANKKPIGTGPFVFNSWKTAEKIELRANPDYFEGRPHFDRYIYRIIPDLSVQFLLLRQGSLSMMTPTPDQYNGYQTFFLNYNKFKYPGPRYDYLAFNLKNPLFQDRRIREAIAHAINKQAIIEGVYQGLAVPATGPFPPQSWAFNQDVKDFSYDPGRAAQLLTEAGWKDVNSDGIRLKDGKPFVFTILTNQGNKVRESICQIIQDNLQKVGIKVDVRILEWSVFIQKYIDERNYEACVLGWNLSRDPDCYPIWHSSQVEKNQYNFVSYANPEVDRLLIEGRTTFDQAKRKAIYQRMHALIHDDVPYVFLVNPLSLPVVHKKILGVELAPLGLGWNFIKWFIPKPWQAHTTMAS